jgi:hypothetical protein
VAPPHEPWSYPSQQQCTGRSERDPKLFSQNPISCMSSDSEDDIVRPGRSAAKGRKQPVIDLSDDESPQISAAKAADTLPGKTYQNQRKTAPKAKEARQLAAEFDAEKPVSAAKPGGSSMMTDAERVEACKMLSEEDETSDTMLIVKTRPPKSRKQQRPDSDDSDYVSETEGEQGNDPEYDDILPPRSSSQRSKSSSARKRPYSSQSQSDSKRSRSSISSTQKVRGNRFVKDAAR